MALDITIKPITIVIAEITVTAINTLFNRSVTFSK